MRTVVVVGVVVVAALYSSGARAQCTCGEPSGATAICDSAGLLAVGSTGSYFLCNDITLDASIPSIGGATFSGTFDGNNRVISGALIDRGGSAYVGLFVKIGAGGAVRRVTLRRFTVIGDDKVGAVAGELQQGGTIEDVRVEDSDIGDNNIRYTNTYFGGVVGENFRGTIRRVVVDAQSTVGSIYGGAVGGVVGLSRGPVIDSGSAAAVRGTTSVGGLVGSCDLCGIDRSWASGAVTGGTSTGGLVGYSFGGQVYSSFALGNVTGNWKAGGLIGSMSGASGVGWSHVYDSAAFGDVTASSTLGGLVGQIEYSHVHRSFSTGVVSAGAARNGAIGMVGGIYYATSAILYDATKNPNMPASNVQSGRTTNEMMTLATFTNAGYAISNDGTQKFFIAAPDLTAYPMLSWARCGNGVVHEALEQCDDGNVAIDDGCSSTCTVEMSVAEWRPIADGTLRTNVAWNYTMGYHFTAMSHAFITDLGGQFQGAKVVRLYDRTSGALLAQTTADGVDTGFVFSPITPTPIIAGRNYTVAVVLGGSGATYRYPLTVQLPRDARDIRIDGSTYVFADARPTNIVTHAMYGQADLKLARADVQTPWQTAENGTLSRDARYTNWLYGYEMTVLRDGHAFSLGGKVEGPFTAILYDVATQQELARADVTGTSQDVYTYGPLATPIPLLAGQRYIVAIWLSGDEYDVIRMDDVDPPYSAGDVVIERRVYDWEQRFPRGTLFHMLGQADLEWAPPQ